MKAIADEADLDYRETRDSLQGLCRHNLVAYCPDRNLGSPAFAL